MCGIAGINGNNISKKLYKMLISMKHRGPDGSGVFIDNKIVYGDLSVLNVPEGSFGLGHNLLSIVGCQGLQPLTDDKLALVCNGEIYNYNKLKKGFEDDFKSDSDSEIILMLIKKFHKGSLYEAILKTVEHLDGDYAFAVYDGKDFAAVRDPLGLKPLYYGKNKEENIFAFASEQKSLWNIGINDVQTLSPTSMIYNEKIIKFNDKISDILTKSQDNLLNNSLSKYKLKEQLKNKLISSVGKRVIGLSEVGILFSGGIDSTVIAKIVSDLGIKTTLYSVGHENSIDLKFSKETALKLNLPIKIKTVDMNDVKNCINPVLDAIEEFNLMKIGVGMPAYIAAEMAHENGLKVLLSGQGADELFGGYNRYLRIYNEKGTIKNEDLWDDILNLYHVNLQRDDAVTMANSIELRVPYLDLDIINTAMNIPMEYKINGKKDNLRKCILREVGMELGVPAEIVKRPKKAAQYGSGIHKMLKKILKEEQFKNLPDQFNKHYNVN